MKKIFKHEIDGESRWFVLVSKTEQQPLHATSFVIKPLTKEDTNEMCKLSQEVYSHLRKDEKTFIHQHDNRHFSSVFNQQDIHYIGVFHNAKLIAMSYIKICQNEKSFFEEIPSDAPPKISPDYSVATFGGDCVHPDFRGNGLNQLMVNFRLHQAKKNGCSLSYSIIDRHNQWNMAPYFNNGFCMISSGIDPNDQGKIAVMRHTPYLSPSKSNSDISIPFCKFEQIDALFKKRFIAYAYNPQNQHLIFTRITPQRISTHCKFAELSTLNKRGEHTHV